MTFFLCYVLWPLSGGFLTVLTALFAPEWVWPVLALYVLGWVFWPLRGPRNRYMEGVHTDFEAEVKRLGMKSGANPAKFFIFLIMALSMCVGMEIALLSFENVSDADSAVELEAQKYND